MELTLVVNSHEDNVTMGLIKRKKEQTHVESL